MGLQPKWVMSRIYIKYEYANAYSDAIFMKLITPRIIKLESKPNQNSGKHFITMNF